MPNTRSTVADGGVLHTSKSPIVRDTLSIACAPVRATPPIEGMALRRGVWSGRDGHLRGPTGVIDDHPPSSSLRGFSLKDARRGCNRNIGKQRFSCFAFCVSRHDTRHTQQRLQVGRLKDRLQCGPGSHTLPPQHSQQQPPPLAWLPL